MTVLALRDELAARTGRPPVRVPTAGAPGATALMTAPDALEGPKARSAGHAIDLPHGHRTGRPAHRALPPRPRPAAPGTPPVPLLCVCEHDERPAGGRRDKARTARPRRRAAPLPRSGAAASSGSRVRARGGRPARIPAETPERLSLCSSNSQKAEAPGVSNPRDPCRHRRLQGSCNQPDSATAPSWCTSCRLTDSRPPEALAHQKIPI